MPGASLRPMERRRGDVVVGEEVERDPWARFGWLLGAVWLVFIVFPVVSIVQDDAPWPWRALGILVVLAFSVVYIHAMRAEDRPEGTSWSVWTYLAVLVALTLATIPTAGIASLGLVPFVLALAGIALRPWQALVALGLALGIASVVVSQVGIEQLAFVYLVYPMVTLTLILVGGLDRSSSRRRASEQRLSISQERERVARDVHDVLGHSLTVVTVKAELAERLVDVDPERAKAELAELRSIARQSLAEIRATVAGLRVARLADEIDSARGAMADAGIALVVDGDPAEVDPRHRITLAWALRELATNVVRHSGATGCVVTLGEDRLVVVDDGRGPRSGREGNGLRGLRERVEPSGGSVVVEAAEPGTRVEVTL
ncbi:two-component system sensor histidine kinase DesK [Janibacter sp. UYMM211]